MQFTNTQDILKRIRQIMADRNIKVIDLASKLGRSQQAISKILSSDNITLDKLNELCNAIDCTLDIDIIDHKAETMTPDEIIAQMGQDTAVIERLLSYSKMANAVHAQQIGRAKRSQSDDNTND